MKNHLYLFDVVINGQGHGSMPFESSSTSIHSLSEDFLVDEDTDIELGVELGNMRLKWVEKFSDKFNDWMRVNRSTTVKKGIAFDSS